MAPKCRPSLRAAAGRTASFARDPSVHARGVRGRWKFLPPNGLHERAGQMWASSDPAQPRNANAYQRNKTSEQYARAAQYEGALVRGYAGHLCAGQAGNQ